MKKVILMIKPKGNTSKEITDEIFGILKDKNMLKNGKIYADKNVDQDEDPRLDNILKAVSSLPSVR